MGLTFPSRAAFIAALFVSAALTATPAAMAQPLRVASFSPDLSRKGPGLLLQDIGKRDPQVLAAARVIAAANADVLLLTDFDWDYEGQALNAFLDLLKDQGAAYPYFHASRPNAGMASGMDLDGDGRLGRADDAQGYGDFTGQGGLALLSRHPIGTITDYSATLWQDLPQNRMPDAVPADARAIRRLSSTAHWDAQITKDGQVLHVLAMAASPPAFGRQPGLNLARNHDELAFWQSHLPDAPFVLMGKLNIDPADGDGDPAALNALLPHLHDPQPRSEGGRLAGAVGVNAAHQGDPALDTAAFGNDRAPGNLRVDYVLPRKDLPVLDSGVLWPADPVLAQDALAASRHRVVWVDLDWPGED